MVINFNFTQVRSAHYAQVIGTNEARFLVGSETVYLGDDGLYNYATPAGLTYNAADYAAEFGFWAHFIAPTARAESKNSFVCLNTYDRARFTFGFMQYAAHVPNGDFVRFFKKLLALPNADEYFPKLILQNGRIFYRETTGTLTQLESDASTQGLMEYLNPTLRDIERQELICAARFVHWAMNDRAHRRLQVEIAIEHFKENMRDYARIYNLDNHPDKICFVVCDIRHQGRAKSRHIIDALNTGGNFERAYNNLLALGQARYPERIRTIRAGVNQLVADGVFNRRYRQAANEFV